MRFVGLVKSIHQVSSNTYNKEGTFPARGNCKRVRDKFGDFGFYRESYEVRGHK